MKILLLGEYSNVHWTLAEGLRSLGHEVCVISDGDSWKNYKRDISLVRKYNRFGSIKYLIKTYALLPKLRGYDIVQIINPMFLELKAERIVPIYRYLKRHNKKIFMGAFGMDTFWVNACTKEPHIFRYSDFNIGERKIENSYTKELRADWINTGKSKLNYEIADSCNGIIAGMYEYHTAYKEIYSKKLTYIPFPIATDTKENITLYNKKRKIRFFIGIQKERSIYKGTDIMLRALERIAEEYNDECEIYKAESVPFEEYQKLVDNSDILLDQLYGYSPGMNALLAMSKGKIVVGGAEEECYNILSEERLRPMVNVTPNEEDVYKQLKWLIENKRNIASLQQESLQFIKKHHDPAKVAKQYIEFWNNK